MNGKGWYDNALHGQSMLRGVVDAVNSLPEQGTRREVVAKLREHLPQVRWLTSSSGKLEAEA